MRRARSWPPFRRASSSRWPREAAELFLTATLPLDPVDGVTQTPQEYVEQLSSTTGMPHVLVRRNMRKIHGVLAQMGEVIAGLTRGLDISVLDTGVGESDGHLFSFYPRGHSLGVVLPNNSPGVHSLWAPAIGLKTPLVLKPGSSEPWTPYRIAYALMQAGVPKSAFCLYPADHAGGGEVLRSTSRGIFFGDASAARRFKGDPRVEVHGPGYSKLVIGKDRIDDWKDLPGDHRRLGRRQRRPLVRERLRPLGHRPCGRDRARAGEASQPGRASRRRRRAGAAGAVCGCRRARARLGDDRRGPGGRRCDRREAQYRGAERVKTTADGTYLLPTVILCDGPEHPLANREFMFPFVSVVPVEEDALPDALGASLVVTLISDNADLQGRLVRSPHVDRLNLGPIPTNQIGWDQPHEGNLFDHLYGRRAIQRVA